jgi:hypothetical protein
MTNHPKHDLWTTVLTTIGAITTTSLGEVVFHVLGTFFLGVIGAAGGYAFAVIIRPKIDEIIAKRKAKKEAKKAT